MKAQTHIEHPHNSQTGNTIGLDTAGRPASFLHRLDIVAIVVVAFSVGLLCLTGVILGLVEVVKLIARHWSSSWDRSVILIICAALFWVLVRWKKK